MTQTEKLNTIRIIFLCACNLFTTKIWTKLEQISFKVIFYHNTRTMSRNRQVSFTNYQYQHKYELSTNQIISQYSTAFDSIPLEQYPNHFAVHKFMVQCYLVNSMFILSDILWKKYCVMSDDWLISSVNQLLSLACLDMNSNISVIKGDIMLSWSMAAAYVLLVIAPNLCTNVMILPSKSFRKFL